MNLPPIAQIPIILANNPDLDPETRSLFESVLSDYDPVDSVSSPSSHPFLDSVNSWLGNVTDFFSGRWLARRAKNAAIDAVSSTNSPAAVNDVVSTVSDLIPPPSDSAAAPSDSAAPSSDSAAPTEDFEADIPGWITSLFETSEQAAVSQWQRNENSARWAYARSEAAADRALERARQLRQTYYQDAMQSLKDAGLNPVLAAGGGIGGASTTSIQANAPSASSSMASGINGADLLSAIAAIITASGNLMKGISSFLPTSILKGVLK